MVTEKRRGNHRTKGSAGGEKDWWTYKPTPTHTHTHTHTEIKYNNYHHTWAQTMENKTLMQSISSTLTLTDKTLTKIGYSKT